MSDQLNMSIISYRPMANDVWANAIENRVTWRGRPSMSLDRNERRFMVESAVDIAILSENSHSTAQQTLDVGPMLL